MKCPSSAEASVGGAEFGQELEQTSASSSVYRPGRRQRGPSRARPGRRSATRPPLRPCQHARPTPGIGMPDGRMGIQDQVTPIGRRPRLPQQLAAAAVRGDQPVRAGAAAVAMVRYRRGANPVPSRNSHNTFDRGGLDAGPGADPGRDRGPSIRLLRHQYSPPPADLTVKVIGNQWYWTYQYPDNGGFEIVSNMLKEKNEVAAAPALPHRRRRPAACWRSTSGW
jgi:cytochrome c oxidase subunit 2